MWFYYVSFVVITCIFFALWFSFILCLHVPSHILFKCHFCPHPTALYSHLTHLSSYLYVSPFFIPSKLSLFPFFPLICSSLLTFPLLLSSPLLSSLHFQPVYLMSSNQACEIPETAVFSLAPCDESSLAKQCSVPYWDLVQTSIQGKVEFPLPLRHMLFSLFPKPDAGDGSAAWSLPAPIQPDFPRQSLSVPRELDSGGGLSSRWVKQSICELLAVTVHLEPPKLASDIKQGGTVASHSLLNTGDEAKGEMPSAFPLSVSLCVMCNWLNCILGISLPWDNCLDDCQ